MPCRSPFLKRAGGTVALIGLTAGLLSQETGPTATTSELALRVPVLYVVRAQYRPDHHNTATFFPRAEHEYNNGTFTPGGALKVAGDGPGGLHTATKTEWPKCVVLQSVAAPKQAIGGGYAT